MADCPYCQRPLTDVPGEEDCPYVVTGDEGTAHCTLDARQAEELGRLTRRLAAALRERDSAVSEIHRMKRHVADLVETIRQVAADLDFDKGWAAKQLRAAAGIEEQG